MPRQRYLIRPMDQGLDYSFAALHAPPGGLLYPTKNIRIDQHSAKKRWGYHTAHRSLGTGIDVQHIIDYQLKTTTAATRHTLYLTRDYIDTTGNETNDTIVGDLCVKKTGSSETFKFITEMGNYDDTIEAITDATNSVITAKAGTEFSSDGVAAGDYFILDADDLADANKETDTSWLAIKSVDSETQLTLTGNYATNGTTGSGWTGGSEKDALIRKTFKVPADERYSWAIVGDKFCFTSGGDDVKYWDGGAATYAVDLETALTVARQARYCIEYANRLIIADYGTTRDPLGIAWSKEGDPTDWTDSTAGSSVFLQSSDPITGLGKVGSSLIIYKRDSYHMGNRTGNAFDPLEFPIHRMAIGLLAPYSLVEVMGTNAWLGRDDFYMMIGDYAKSIGKEIRDFFFEEVTQANAEKVWGFVNELEYEIIWVATSTTYGQLGFIFNYHTKKWYTYDFNDTLTGAGRGI